MFFVVFLEVFFFLSCNAMLSVCSELAVPLQQVPHGEAWLPPTTTSLLLLPCLLCSPLLPQSALSIHSPWITESMEMI